MTCASCAHSAQVMGRAGLVLWCDLLRKMASRKCGLFVYCPGSDEGEK